eukprot:CAMPEP_0119346880 /NCGR_PEP_ID=MMETSP1333-20130426/108234_1 /TAXON_ID=418940 /ORGANISM="Scyphosphaera apsteinii, Strain RCC1455" /LENGTH=452 /DNA_ID=CAMNT_0007359401 /DNA_START=72 /DNA_END=1430 /DNA_ORIENTATION=-
MPPVSLTIASPTNIAVIKYWGKRNSKLNLPINSSVSVTLNQQDLRTVTTVCASRDFGKDRLWLNGKEEDVSGNKRVQAVFKEVRAYAGDLFDLKSGHLLVKRSEWPEMKVHVISTNNFPTAAGLASSAAGYAALTFALAQLFAVPKTVNLSTIARQGSGSACRSLAGGFVAWDMGSKDDGSDSSARQVAPASHWPELQVLILVVSDSKKTVSSTAGMDISVDTSLLLAHRAAQIVPERLKQMESAYLAKDFAAVANLAMQDSNQFHATCLDTFPPIFYLNDVSRAIIGFVHAFNDACGEVRLGYTFDAGPNAVLLVLKEHITQALGAILHYFPPRAGCDVGYVNRADLYASARATALPDGLESLYPLTPMPSAVRYVYHSDVGPGAMIVDDDESLADASGMPKVISASESNKTCVSSNVPAPLRSLQVRVLSTAAISVAFLFGMAVLRTAHK